MKVTKTGKWSEGCSALGMTCKVPQNCDFHMTSNISHHCKSSDIKSPNLHRTAQHSAASQPFLFSPRHWRMEMMEQSLDKPSRSRCFLVWKLLALPIAPQEGLRQETSNASFTVDFQTFMWRILVSVPCWSAVPIQPWTSPLSLPERFSSPWGCTYGKPRTSSPSTRRREFHGKKRGLDSTSLPCRFNQQMRDRSTVDHLPSRAVSVLSRKSMWINSILSILPMQYPESSKLPESNFP